MASDDLGIVSRSVASLEHLHTELIQAGFNPADSHLKVWKGPIAEPFQKLTSATTMRVIFQDGWPFRSPKIFVNGIVGEHVNSKGEVCLWTAGDLTFQWLTLDGIHERIKIWCQRALEGFKEEDLVLDAHLYFENSDPTPTLAIVDLTSLKQGAFEDDDRGDFYGLVDKNNHIRITAGVGERTSLRGRWYYRSEIAIPPHDLFNFRNSLSTNQQRNFDRKINATRKSGEKAIQLAALIWGTPQGLNALIIKLELVDTEVKAIALQAAPIDEQSLRLRGGPDSKLLSTKRVVLFGAGAIGSHIALLLAEMGVQAIILVDGDILRPGNLVRHTAGVQFIGLKKVTAVKNIIGEHAPWTQVEAIASSPWHPEEIKKHLQGVHLVLEATGLSSFAAHLSTITEEASLSLLSTALYRGGEIARIRRQIPARDFPIYRRKEPETQYPIIPPGESEILGLELGCSDPIINAPPAAVTAAATISVRMAVDILTGRAGRAHQLIEVYERLTVPPFDKIGLIEIGGNGNI